MITPKQDAERAAARLVKSDDLLKVIHAFRMSRLELAATFDVDNQPEHVLGSMRDYHSAEEFKAFVEELAANHDDGAD